jgi:hypothetical protein
MQFPPSFHLSVPPGPNILLSIPILSVILMIVTKALFLKVSRSSYFYIVFNIEPAG